MREKCLALLALWAGLAAAAEYEVGPGKPLAELDQVPWESLAPGDRVSVHWRQQPYRSKIILAVEATEQQPLVLRGVPSASGELPVIDGQDATTRAGVNFWGETRGLLKIGGSNHPDCSPPDCVPSWIVVENLDLRSARPPYSFTGRDGLTAYDQNAAAFYIEVGRHIVIRNCRLHDSGNGLFIGVYDGETQDILVEGNHVFDNGNADSIYEHNSYTSARGIVFQYNHYGPLRTGCLGNNLKDRSAGLVVRYNWIENGNRQLDLVDGEDSPAVPNDPLYRETFVYGNLLVEAEGEGNSQIVHYGGDSGDTDIYRKGTLYFYNNTVVSTRSGNTTLFRLSSNDEHCDMRNNLVWVTAAGSRLAMLSENGALKLTHNLMKPGWTSSHGSLAGTIDDDGTTVEVSDPGFADLPGQDFHLLQNSPAVNAATALAAGAAAYPVTEQYLRHQAGESRPVYGEMDIGAYEYAPGGVVDAGPDGEDGGTADAGTDAGVDAGDPNDAGGDEAAPDGDGLHDGGPVEDDKSDSGTDDDSGPADAGDRVADGGGPLQGSCSCSAPAGTAAPLLFLFAWLVIRRRKHSPGGN